MNDNALLAAAEAAATRAMEDGRITHDQRESYVRGYLLNARKQTMKHAGMTTMILHADSQGELADIKTKDLVGYYNAHAEKPVKKFSSRIVAEKRVLELANTIAARTKLVANKAKDKKAKKPADDEDTTAKRAASCSESWKDEDVAAARKARWHVKVKGQEYRSVRQAFAELGLPDVHHQKFRKELVAAGTATYDGIKFTAIPA